MHNTPIERDPCLTKLLTRCITGIVLMIASTLLGTSVPQHSIWNFIASVGVISGIVIAVGGCIMQVVYQGLELKEMTSRPGHKK